MGNPQQLGQQPLTFNRQVLSLCLCPPLMDNPSVTQLFPTDAVKRAREITGYLSGSLGAYSDSRGAAGIRQEVADMIAARDGCAPECLVVAARRVLPRPPRPPGVLSCNILRF